MSSPVVAPDGSGTPARRSSARAHFLAIVAIVSVVVLIDAEIIAYGIPGIVAAFDLMRIPVIFTYAAIGVLGLFTLWLSVWLVRKIWRVEHELNAAPPVPETSPTC